MEQQAPMNTGSLNVTLEDARVSATATVIANFAWQHLKAATIFRDHVISLRTEHAGEPIEPFFNELRSYGSGCIMSATASLEALINELFIAHNTPLRNKLVDFEREFWGKDGIERKGILTKYQIALALLGVTKLDEAARTYQDAAGLVALRNALTHYKPTWDPEQTSRVELAQLLAGRFELGKFQDSSADFVSMKCMSAGCARWAVDTALAFMREFDRCTNLDPGKMAGFWQLADKREPGAAFNTDNNENPADAGGVSY